MNQIKPEELTPREWTEYQMGVLQLVIDGVGIIHRWEVGEDDPQLVEEFAWVDGEESPEVSAIKAGNSFDAFYLGTLTVEQAQARREELQQSSNPQ